MDAQLKRGILSMCILQLLKEDRYGYDLVKILQEFFPDTEESTLYAILRRLNREGLTDLHESGLSHGPKRKYYRISEKGEERLKDYIASWSEIEKIFGRIGIIIGFDQIRREDGL